MAHFDALRPKVYRYLINNGDDNKKKSKRHRNCIIKIKFEG